MSSNMRITVLSGRSSNSVKGWLRLLPGFRPEVIERVGSFFSDIAGGVHSGHLNIATNTIPATGTLTMSGFSNGDTLTVADEVYGTTGIPDNHLLTASTYAALGKTAVTAASTGTGTSLVGDLGNVDAASITGFPNGTYTGSLHSGDAAAAQANTDATAAYAYYTGLPGFTDISATDLGGYTMAPGNYLYTSAATWSAGALTFDAAGDPNAIFVIKTGTTLVTPSAASVVLLNGAKASNIYWMIGSSATMGTSSSLAGTIIAQVSVTMNTTTTLAGRALALTGAVTLDQSTVTVPTPPVPPPAENQFVVGANDTETAANAVAVINANGTCLVSASSVGPVITITSTVPGTIGNFLPIAMSGGTASGAFLTGGSEDACLRVYNGIREPGTGAYQVNI